MREQLGIIYKDHDFVELFAHRGQPAESPWRKADLKWASFKTLDQLQAKVDQLLAQLTPEAIASITGYSFILDALSALSPV